MHVYTIHKYYAQESNLPAFRIAQTHYTCTVFACIESKFHDGILQVREPSSLQASNGMLVSGYTGKSQVKQNDLCLPRSEATNACQTLRLMSFQVHAGKNDLSPIAGLADQLISHCTQRSAWHVFKVRSSTKQLEKWGSPGRPSYPTSNDLVNVNIYLVTFQWWMLWWRVSAHWLSRIFLGCQLPACHW